MIVRFFKTGLSNGEAPVNYLLRDTDHQGGKRSDTPEILFGNPDQTIRLINNCTRKHKYSSGVVAFRAEDNPTRQQIFDILDRFRETIAPGISPDQYNTLFVLHRDPPDRKSGLAACHVHFVIPMTFLGGETHNGKSLTGMRFNPHPPGKQSIETIRLFTAVTNHEHGWKQVVEQPLRVGVDSFWRKVDGQANERRIGILQEYLSEQVKGGTLTNRDDLIQFIQNDLGCEITRKSDSYISVRLPHFKKAVRLKGKLFEASTDYAREFSTHSIESRTVSTLTVPDYEQAKERLNQLLEERKPYLLGYRPKPSTTTEKEKTDGRQQSKRTTGSERRGADAHRGAKGELRSTKLHPDGTHIESSRGNKPDQGVHRRSHAGHQSPAPATRTPRANSRRVGISGHGSNCGSTGTQRSQIPRTSSTGSSASRGNPSSGLSGQIGGSGQEPDRTNAGKIPQPSSQGYIPTRISTLGMSAADIDDQIRKLCIAQASASFEAQAVIQDSINDLVGRRENLPKPK